MLSTRDRGGLIAIESLVRIACSTFVSLLLFSGYAPARFLQVDPVVYDDQQNLYAFVENDPVNRVDPDGRQSDTVMDRRNQAFLQAANECEGGCLETYCAAIAVAATGVAIVVDVLD